MSSAWKWKLFAVIVSFVVGIYLLVPTVFRFDAKRAALESAGESIPWYIEVFPKKALNLGLDLRGGIYVEMQVDLPSAIKRKADVFAGEITRYLKDEKITPVAIDQPGNDGVLHVQMASAEDISVLSRLLDKTNSMFVKSSTTVEDGHPTMILKIRDDAKNALKSSIVDQALQTVRNRIDRYGVAEPNITKAGDDRIAIELPGLTDPERAISIIKSTGQLEFRLVDDSVSGPDLEKLIIDVRKDKNIPDGFTAEITAKINEALNGKIPAKSEVAFEVVRDPITKKIVSGRPYLVSKKAELTGDMLEDAQSRIENNEPNVQIIFNKAGAQLFADLTKANVKKRLAILLDGNINSAPVINEPILGGHARITLGMGDYQSLLSEANDLALILQEGALPATLTEATKNVVGPSLGQESINAGLKAALIAALLVIVFMIFYYRISGFYADVALMLNMLLILALLSIFGATLTLPGITGMVLTMGMAVDANILILERIREELRLGKTVKAAVESGYANALRAVIDTHITTLISGIVLYQFGTGPIKGFAVTLSIGIITTLFTAIVVTRLIYDYRIIKHKLTTLSI